MLAALVDPAKFPYALRVGGATGQFDAAVDPRRAYEFGLRTILDGVEKLVQRPR